MEIKDADSGSFICRAVGCMEGRTSNFEHGPGFYLAQPSTGPT